MLWHEPDTAIDVLSRSWVFCRAGHWHIMHWQFLVPVVIGSGAASIYAGSLCFTLCPKETRHSSVVRKPTKCVLRGEGESHHKPMVPRTVLLLSLKWKHGVDILRPGGQKKRMEAELRTD